MRCLLLLFLTSCTLYGADYIRDYRNSANLSVYPAKYKANWTKTPEGCRLSRSALLPSSLSVHGHWKLPEKYIELSGKIRYRATCTDEKSESIRMTLNFNKKNSRNGSAGSVRFPVPQSAEMREFQFHAAVPKDAVGFQMVISLAGGDAEFVLQKLELTYARDQAEIEKLPSGAVWKQLPSTWKLRAMQPFYNHATGEPAQTETQVKFRFDDSAFYAGFIASEMEMKYLVDQVKEHDGPVWKDDCVELFLFDPAKNTGWHFAVNPAGTHFDGLLYQRVPGDPYRTSREWNGVWESAVFRKTERWETVIKIPWKTLGYDSVPRKLLVNAARERKTVPENSHILTARGDFRAVDRFAEIDFTADPVQLVRSQAIENITYVPSRKKPVFDEVFTSENGNYTLGAWAGGIYKADFPPALRNRITDEEFMKWQDRLLEAWSKAKMTGPFLPWAETPANLIGIEKLKEFHRRTGMKYPYALFGSGLRMTAIRKFEPRYFISAQNFIDPTDPAYLKSVESTLAGIFRRTQNDPEYRKMLAFFHGIDEPTNQTAHCFSPTRNPEGKAALEGADRMIRETTGFGKFGLYDRFAPADAEAPFRRIAFWRWWNRQFRNYLAATSKLLREQLPEVPYLGYNRNTTAGIDLTDVALLSPESTWIGCDPYPTSTAALYGMARAVYHTGFSVKMTADLAAKSEVCVMPQGFIYHGIKPSREDIREWTAQSLKNGARHFFWYTGDLAIRNASDVYSEMLGMNRRMASMKKLDIPKESAVGVFFSEYDKWALEDSAGHAAYTIYTILGEHLGVWFRFVSQSSIFQNRAALGHFRLLIVPRLRFCDRTTLNALRKFMDKGGTLVMLDPGFLRYHIDGSAFAEREQWLGGVHLTRKKLESDSLTAADGKKLPLSKVRNLTDGENGTFDAWDFSGIPSGATLLASYPDGKPAIIRLKHGNGTLIVSAVQPFGDSSAAVKPGEWMSFFRHFTNETGEPPDRPIWRFTISKGKETSLLKLPF